MLTVSSNIAGVIERTRAYRDRIPGAMQRALQPALWIDEARLVARSTLAALADETTRGLIEPFLREVMAEWKDGLCLTMRMPFEAGLKGGGLSLGSIVDKARDRFLPLFSESFLADRTTAREVIHQWVLDEKDIDERDHGKTTDQITDGLMAILFGGRRSWERELASQELLKTEAEAGPHLGGGLRLVDYFAAHPLTRDDGGAVMKAKIEEWLLAVLAAWKTMMAAQYPERLRAELNTD